MKPIFADTSYFVAMCGPRDVHHARALEWNATSYAPIVTTEYVVVETGSLLVRPEDRFAYVNLVRDLQSDPGTLIVPASRSLFQRGFDLFIARPDKNWSMVDCLSFIVMNTRRIKNALTADHHFEQAGFKALLRDT